MQNVVLHHPFRKQIEAYFSQRDFTAEVSTLCEGSVRQYSCCESDGTTFVIRLQSHAKNSQTSHWFEAEFGVGPVADALANELLAQVARRAHGCNFPYRPLIIPHDDGEHLLLLQFRSEAALIREAYLIELIEAGFGFAALLREEFGVMTIASKSAI